MRRTAIACLAVLVLAAACEREARRTETGMPPVKSAGPMQGKLQPGEPGKGITASPGPLYQEGNALYVATGKRLFRWYNCNGCHASGGGSYGPALTDATWIYGSSPENIHETIAGGRPNGMPSFRGRVPDEQVWQLVAYVRSLGGFVAKDVTSSRGDSLGVVDK
jgi:cytochrome c oxidase cbb3-type subunit III